MRRWIATLPLLDAGVANAQEAIQLDRGAQNVTGAIIPGRQAARIDDVKLVAGRSRVTIPAQSRACHCATTGRWNEGGRSYSFRAVRE
jgi:hypothetical protein